MEWTEKELQIVGVEDCKEAIRSVLEKSLVVNGRVTLDHLTRAEIDYAVHLLRAYRVLLSGPASPGGERLAAQSAA